MNCETAMTQLAELLDNHRIEVEDLNKQIAELEKELDELKNYIDICLDNSKEQLIRRIVPINLHEVKDGVYVMKATDIRLDRETGYIDDWDVILVPYKEQE